MAANKMSFKEMKEILINFESMDKHKKECIAKKNRMTVNQLKRELEEICYELENLGIMQKKALLKEMQGMNEIEVKMIEEVNGMTYLEIKELLISEITAYDESAKRIRKYNKLMKIETRKVSQEMILDGLIIVDKYGVKRIIDYSEHEDRLIKASDSVARECGLEIKDYHYYPLLGLYAEL